MLNNSNITREEMESNPRAVLNVLEFYSGSKDDDESKVEIRAPDTHKLEEIKSKSDNTLAPNLKVFKLLIRTNYPLHHRYQMEE
jgi:hypothetical protein